MFSALMKNTDSAGVILLVTYYDEMAHQHSSFEVK